MLYGADTQGVADTMLEKTRRAAANAAAPEAGGKNYDLVLLALDGSRGVLDPAFMAITWCADVAYLIVRLSWSGHLVLRASTLPPPLLSVAVRPISAGGLGGAGEAR